MTLIVNNVKDKFADLCQQAIAECYGSKIDRNDLLINATRSEFEGDYTLVTFSLTKLLKSNPVQIAEKLGEYLRSQGLIDSFNVVKGFLNCSLNSQAWLEFLKELNDGTSYGCGSAKNETVLVEFSSPNTNKPLHLGHVRNMLLGWSVASIVEEVGYEVKKVQIINDRGIAICKSMLAWQLYGKGSTPQSTGIKGDHFVGDYYVKFESEFKKEYEAWQQTDEAKALLVKKRQQEKEDDFFKGFKNQYFNEYSDLGVRAKEMLRSWESGDSTVVGLWTEMNGWVYSGFDSTYSRLGIDFDKNYYESETYLLGKEIIDKGLADEVFYRRDDGSVWINLEDANMDQKILLRSDGTSVYMTQDLGTAEIRYKDFGASRMVYVVANEQNYHFEVLFEISKRLRTAYADGLYHLSYGMVELPEGRMKSREGTVVDADDLIDEVVKEARQIASEKGEIDHLPDEEQEDIIDAIGLAALKFFMIKVSPQKRMVFNPADSVDMHGQTGPYIQNAYVRIASVLRGQEVRWTALENVDYSYGLTEKQLLMLLDEYPYVLREAAEKYDPALLANYCYRLAKMYHRFYSELPIRSAEEPNRSFRLILSKNVGKVLKRAMSLLGIAMPDKM